MQFTKLVLTIRDNTLELEGALEFTPDVLHLVGQWFGALPPAPDAGTAVVRAEISALKEVLVSKTDDILAKATEIQAANASMGDTLTAQSASLDNISADLDRVKAQLAGGVSAEEADGILAVLGGVSDSVTATAAALKEGAAKAKAISEVIPEDAPEPPATPVV